MVQVGALFLAQIILISYTVSGCCPGKTYRNVPYFQQIVPSSISSTAQFPSPQQLIDRVQIGAVISRGELALDAVHPLLQLVHLTGEAIALFPALSFLFYSITK